MTFVNSTLTEQETIANIHRRLHYIYRDQVVDRSTVSRWVSRVSATERGKASLYMSCCQEVKRRIAMVKEAFNRKRSIFCGFLEKELRKRLVKCFVWCVALYGAETWTYDEVKRRE
ncbi:hypothetical protein ANN_20122 [Periplaneta americana]|uniref:Mos1 transposase HTH domain-containing protein n=1 Tax=Periplaneta americana TaxID=6978 RepID=A0ABQ8SCC1_PERAM|nr:hypothetical protein ANN_20122 [Periplaneta americana]